jgi:hypothetical protein
MIPPFQPEPGQKIHPYSLTFLDHEETTTTPNHDQPPTPTADPDGQAHLSFRHSFWETRRRCTLDAIRLLHPASRRLTAFQACGINAWVVRSDQPPHRYRVRTNKCRDRFCEACAGEKRRLVAFNVARQLPKCHLRLLTLTIKSTATPLTDQIDRIYNAFRTFRNRRPIQKRITGGLYFLEITVNPASRLWHPHLHVICMGSYLPVDLVRRHWFDVTHDSYICDVRYIKTPGHAAGYVTKYAGKTIPITVWRDPKLLQEAIRAMENRRTFQTFGKMKHLDLSRIPDEDTTWTPIASLATILTQAKAGDPIATDILNQIRRPENLPQDLLDTS